MPFRTREAPEERAALTITSAQELQLANMFRACGLRGSEENLQEITKYITASPEQRAGMDVDDNIRELGDRILRDATEEEGRLNFPLETVMRAALEYREAHPELIPESERVRFNEDDTRWLRRHARQGGLDPDQTLRAFRELAVMLPNFIRSDQEGSAAFGLASRGDRDMEQFLRIYSRTSPIFGNILQYSTSHEAIQSPLFEEPIMRRASEEYAAYRRERPSSPVEDEFAGMGLVDLGPMRRAIPRREEEVVRRPTERRARPRAELTAGQRRLNEAITGWGGNVAVVTGYLRILQRGGRLRGRSRDAQIARALHETFRRNGVRLTDVTTRRGWDRLNTGLQGELIAAIPMAYVPSREPAREETSPAQDALATYIADRGGTPETVMGYLRDLEESRGDLMLFGPDGELAEEIFSQLRNAEIRPSDLTPERWTRIPEDRRRDLLAMDIFRVREERRRGGRRRA